MKRFGCGVHIKFGGVWCVQEHALLACCNVAAPIMSFTASCSVGGALLFALLSDKVKLCETRTFVNGQIG